MSQTPFPSVAQLIVVNDSAIAAQQKNPSAMPLALALAMLFGLKLVTPPYLADHSSGQSLQYIGAAKVQRGICLSDRFQKKHPKLAMATGQAASKCSGGWTLISEVCIGAWKTAGRKVAHINTLDEFASTLISDVKHDRLRSSRGTFM